MNVETTTLTRRFRQAWKWLSAPPREPVDDCTDWYGGLAVDPESFSKQLVNLQQSLQTATRMQPKAENPEIEFGSGSESAA